MPEIHAEHGATLSCLGRLATLNSVVTTSTEEFALFGRQQYKDAHEELKQGNNGYYRVSNAMTAARHERLNGTPQGALLWLGRAVTGLGWTAAHDRTNFVPAAKTLASRAQHLNPFDRKAAESSVEVKP